MTGKPSAAATLTWLLFVLGGAVHATEVVSVGRVDMQLPGEGWQGHAVTDPGNVMTGPGETHRQRAETRVLLRRAPDQTIDAVFIVRANVSGKGRASGVIYSDARCEGPAGTFTEGDPPGPAAKSLQCLFVSQPGAVRLLAGVSAASVQWGRLLQESVTDSVYSVWGKLPLPDILPSGAPSHSH